MERGVEGWREGGREGKAGQGRGSGGKKQGKQHDMNIYIYGYMIQKYS